MTDEQLLREHIAGRHHASWLADHALHRTVWEAHYRWHLFGWSSHEHGAWALWRQPASVEDGERQ